MNLMCIFMNYLNNVICSIFYINKKQNNKIDLSNPIVIISDNGNKEIYYQLK